MIHHEETRVKLAEVGYRDESKFFIHWTAKLANNLGKVKKKGPPRGGARRANSDSGVLEKLNPSASKLRRGAHELTGAEIAYPKPIAFVRPRLAKAENEISGDDSINETLFTKTEKQNPALIQDGEILACLAKSAFESVAEQKEFLHIPGGESKVGNRKLGHHELLDVKNFHNGKRNTMSGPIRQTKKNKKEKRARSFLPAPFTPLSNNP